MAKVVVFPVGTGEKRYTCNGVLEINGTPARMLDSLLKSMDGDGVYSQGVWNIWAAGPADPDADVIDESWLNGGISFKRGASKNEKINTASGTYINPLDYWAATGFPSVSIPDYVDEDQEELTADLVLNFCTSGFQAQRMGRLAIERSRNGMVVTYPCNLKALQVKVNEVRKVNNALLGWNEKLFRVLDWQFSMTGGINLTLGEYNGAIYDIPSSDLRPIPTPDPTNLPDPWTVPAPTGLTPAESLYATNVASVIMCRVDLSWIQPSVGITLYEIEQNSGSGWLSVGQSPLETCTLWDVQPGAQQFRVRAVNGLGVKSAWSTLNYTVLGKTAPPSDVTGLQIAVVRGQMLISWAAVPDLDANAYEIQLGTVWDAPGNAILVQDYSGTSYPWTPDRTGTISFLIKAKDTSSNYSTNATHLNYVVVAPGPVIGMYQKVIDNIVELHWEQGTVGSFPIDYYELYRGTDFATAVSLGKKYVTADLRSEDLAGSYKYWVVAVDIAGLRSAEAGIYAKVDQPPDYVLHDQRDLIWANGTLVNAVVEGTELVVPVNTTETFQAHFTSPGYSTPQDQINAGKPIFIQSGMTAGSYEEIIDYGAGSPVVIPSVKVTLTVTRITIAGTVTVTPTLYSSTDGSTWTNLGNVYETLAQNFRFLKVHLDIATADNGILRIQQATVKLDVKERNLVTTMNVTDIVSDGTLITFASLGIAPIDVKGITAVAPYTGNATNDPIDARINFTDTPNPTSFKVLAWNKSVARVAVNGVTVTIRYT